VKVIALVVSKNVRLACASAVKQCVPDSATMDMIASVAAVRASGFNPSLSKRDRNFGFLCKALMAAGVMVGFVATDSSMSISLALPWIITEIVALPLCRCGLFAKLVGAPRFHLEFLYGIFFEGSNNLLWSVGNILGFSSLLRLLPLKLPGA
jgi:hypothetical protein